MWGNLTLTLCNSVSVGWRFDHTIELAQSLNAYVVKAKASVFTILQNMGEVCII